MVTITGGDKFKAILADISNQLAKGEGVKVGILEGATYPAGDTHSIRTEYRKRNAAGKDGAIAGEKGGQPVAMVAAILEYGAPNAGIPPRPAIRQMVAENAPAWPAAVGRLIKGANYDTAIALGRFGEGVRRQWQQAYDEFSGTPLKAATIERKGFDKQLIDTSHLKNSVDYEVES